ncbi:hypothetical protein [Roseibium sp. Sym1]|uniref:hypothetical protein n=1 Tax=Roseibium sp. Sym1 TaxID=3016006 RepID=UPI0022B3BC5E|nr:hypothetical protein [Roseibium sp. Sym1]
MSVSGSVGKARREARCGASGKRRNAADGPDTLTRNSPDAYEKQLKMGRTVWRAGVVGPPLWWETPPRVTRLASAPNRLGQMTLIDRKTL